MACLTGLSVRNRRGLRSPKLPTITDETNVPLSRMRSMCRLCGTTYLAISDQGRHPSSLNSAYRLAKGLTAAGVGIASIAIIGLYWN